MHGYFLGRPAQTWIDALKPRQPASKPMIAASDLRARVTRERRQAPVRRFHGAAA
jgi:hypothetical protein